MAFPEVIVELATGVDPTVDYLLLDDPTRGLLDTGRLAPEGGVWTDISAYVKQVTTSRGRQRLLEQYRTGTCSVVVDNADGRFSPHNLSGPYVAGGVTLLQPERRIRIRAEYGPPNPTAMADPIAIAITPDGATAYVVNQDDNTVTPIVLATGIAGTPIAIGVAPVAVAITPDGTKAYVVNSGDDTVTPITIATGTGGTPIAVGGLPRDIAITPDGTKAYVVNSTDDTVTPITIATGTGGTPIAVGGTPRAVAITPDGTKAYVCDAGDDTVTPITIATGTAGTPIAVGNTPNAIAITPDGTKAYVTCAADRSVTPIVLATDTAGSPIGIGVEPTDIAITPDGTKAYVVGNDNDTVVPIVLVAGLAGTPVAVGANPTDIAITPDGATAYVTCANPSDIVTYFNTLDDHIGPSWGLFQGFVDAYSPEWPHPQGGRVTITASDAFKVLARFDPAAADSPVGAGEDTGARVERILDLASWPDGDRVVATGDSTLQSTTLAQNALTELFLSVDSELGAVYTDESGKVAFENRHAVLQSPRSNISQATFGDTPGAIPYFETEVAAFDSSLVKNDVSIANVGGTAQAASDDASIARYWHQTWQRHDLILQTDAEALAYAQTIVATNADAEQRIDGVLLRGLPDDEDRNVWPQILGRRLRDKATVVRTPAQGDALELPVFVEGIDHQIDPGNQWVCRFNLASASAFTEPGFFILDHQVLGALDENKLSAF